MINWDCSAQDIVNHVRAFNPSPTAFTYLNGEIFKIYRAEICEIIGNAGDVVKNDGELVVGCKDKSVRLTEVCRSGGKIMTDKAFLLGNKVSVGEKLGL